MCCALRETKEWLLILQWDCATLSGVILGKLGQLVERKGKFSLQWRWLQWINFCTLGALDRFKGFKYRCCPIWTSRIISMSSLEAYNTHLIYDVSTIPPNSFLAQNWIQAREDLPTNPCSQPSYNLSIKFLSAYPPTDIPSLSASITEDFNIGIFHVAIFLEFLHGLIINYCPLLALTRCLTLDHTWEGIELQISILKVFALGLLFPARVGVRCDNEAHSRSCIASGWNGVETGFWSQSCLKLSLRCWTCRTDCMYHLLV